MKYLLTFLLCLTCNAAWVPFANHATNSADAKVTIIPEYVATNGLFAFWSLDEEGDIDRVDSWGGHDLKVRATANVDHTNGVLNNAVAVTAANAAGDLTNDASGMTFNDFTISFWFYPSNKTGPTFVYCGTNATSRTFSSSACWALYANPTFRVSINNTLTTLSSMTFPLTEWTHVTFVYSNSVARCWGYRNGAFVQSVSTPTLGSISPASFSIYGVSDSGYKDEILIYSRCLEPAEIEVLYRMKQWKDWPNLRYR